MALCSVVIIAYNARQTIEKCIQSAFLITDDVVVVDSGSTDNTTEIATNLGARVFTKSWVGYSANKNYGNKLAKHDFIFWLDADEEIPMPLADEVLSNLKNIDTYSCLRIKRLNFFKHKPIRHGAWKNDLQIRVFNRNVVEWNENISVHETLNISNVKHDILIQNMLHHYTTSGFNDYLQKMKKYAAQYRTGKPKGNFFKMIFSPLSRLIGEYFFKLGMLDGIAGLQIAAAHAYYAFLKYKI